MCLNNDRKKQLEKHSGCAVVKHSNSHPKMESSIERMGKKFLNQDIYDKIRAFTIQNTFNSHK
jgi:hypothetical protein